MSAADLTRSLIKQIVMTPVDGELQIDVRGELGIPTPWAAFSKSME